MMKLIRQQEGPGSRGGRRDQVSEEYWELEKMAAECELIANLAIDKSTRKKNVRKAEQYKKIADRLRGRLDHLR